MRNIVKDFVEYDKKCIQEYSKLMIDENVDQGIIDTIINTYVDVRYYDLFNHISNSPIETIDYYIKKNIEKYLDDNSEKKVSTTKLNRNIKLALWLIKYMLYFEKASTDKKLKGLLDNLENSIRVQVDFDEEKKNKLFDIIRTCVKNKKDFIRKCSTKEFNLIENATNINDVFDCNLECYTKIPDLFSEVAINRSYTTGIVLEDKMPVCYTLASLSILKSILEFDYKKQLLVEFAPVLLTKNNKLSMTFKIIDSDLLKDKLNFKITYKDFLDNKDRVYELIHDGYKFAVVVDENFSDNVQLLEVFSYIIAKTDKIPGLSNFDNVIIGE